MKENLAARWLETCDLQVENISIADPEPDQVQIKVAVPGSAVPTCTPLEGMRLPPSEVFPAMK